MPTTSKTIKAPIFSPIQFGTAIGLATSCFFLGGGYDAYMVFFTNRIETVPAWVHLITTPIGLLPWPLSWAVLSFLTVLAALWAKKELHGRWWLMVFSAPMLWEIWSGQIEWMVVLGGVLGLSVIQKKLPSVWLGVSILLLLSKPWVGWGMALLFLIQGWQMFGLRRLLPAGVIVMVILGLTFIFWPEWIQDFVNRMLAYENNELNGALWPWGILSWALVPNFKTKELSLTRVAAASILSSPYLRLYHALLLLAFDDDASTFWVGWGILATALFGLQFRNYAWILPLFVLVREKIREGRPNRVSQEVGEVLI